MVLNVVLILPLLPILGWGLLGALVSPLITFSMIKLFGWDEDEIKDTVKTNSPDATKIKIDSKVFHSGSTKLDVGIWSEKEQIGTQPIEVEGRCPDSVYVGKVYYLDD